MAFTSSRPATIAYAGRQTDSMCQKCEDDVLVPAAWHWIPFGKVWHRVTFCRKCAEDYERKWKGGIIKYCRSM